MFSWYKYLIVGLVFSHLGFWSGNLFLIAPFPDLCLLVPFYLICYVLTNILCVRAENVVLLSCLDLTLCLFEYGP